MSKMSSRKTKSLILIILSLILILSCNNDFFYDLIPPSGDRIESFSVSGQKNSNIGDNNVTFTVTPDFDLRKVVPSITISEKATIVPITMDYVLKVFPQEDLIKLSMKLYTLDMPAIIDLVIDTITKNKDFNAPAIDIPIDFQQPVTFVVVSAMGTSRTYSISAKVDSTTVVMTDFIFSKYNNPELITDARGTIDHSNRTINVNVLYPMDFPISYKLIPTFVISGDKVIDKNSATIKSDETEILFSPIGNATFDPVYPGLGTVTTELTVSKSGYPSTTYTLNIIFAEDPDSIRSIIDFRFYKADNLGKIKSTAMGAISKDGDYGFIDVTVFYDGNAATPPPYNLTPAFLSPGIVTVSGVEQFSSVSGQNFSKTIEYLCTARNANFRRLYTVQVNFVRIEPAAETQASISDFGFRKIANSGMALDSQATINQDKGIILAEVKYAGATPPESLIPYFSATGTVKVRDVIQSSGFSSGDFRYVVIYKVASFDGARTKDYRVEINFVRDDRSACELKTFNFEKLRNVTLSKDVIGNIDQRNMTIFMLIPFGGDSANTDFVANFTAEGTIKIDGVEMTSGFSTLNYSKPKTLTVTSINGLYTKSYTISLQEVGGIVYVNKSAMGKNNGTSWTNAFTTIDDAMRSLDSASSSTTEVWVTKGDYSLLTNGIPVSSNTLVVGGFEGDEKATSERVAGIKTTLKFNGASKKLFVGSGLKGTVMIDSFEFKDIKLNGTGSALKDSAILFDLKFSDNATTSGVELINCTFDNIYDTSDRRALIYVDGNLILSNSKFSDIYAKGDTLFHITKNFTINESEFSNITEKESIKNRGVARVGKNFTLKESSFKSIQMVTDSTGFDVSGDVLIEKGIFDTVGESKWNYMTGYYEADNISVLFKIAGKVNIGESVFDNIFGATLNIDNSGKSTTLYRSTFAHCFEDSDKSRDLINIHIKDGGDLNIDGSTFSDELLTDSSYRRNFISGSSSIPRITSVVPTHIVAENLKSSSTKGTLNITNTNINKITSGNKSLGYIALSGFNNVNITGSDISAVAKIGGKNVTISGTTYNSYLRCFDTFKFGSYLATNDYQYNEEISIYDTVNGAMAESSVTIANSTFNMASVEVFINGRWGEYISYSKGLIFINGEGSVNGSTFNNVLSGGIRSTKKLTISDSTFTGIRNYFDNNNKHNAVNPFISCPINSTFERTSFSGISMRQYQAITSSIRELIFDLVNEGGFDRNLTFNDCKFNTLAFTKQFVPTNIDKPIALLKFIRCEVNVGFYQTVPDHNYNVIFKESKISSALSILGTVDIDGSSVIGGTMVAKALGSSFVDSTMSGGSLSIYGATVSDNSISGNSTYLYCYSNSTIKDCNISYYGNIMLDSGSINDCSFIGGNLTLSSAAAADNATFASNGKLTLNSSSTATNCRASNSTISVNDGSTFKNSTSVKDTTTIVAGAGSIMTNCTISGGSVGVNSEGTLSYSPSIIGTRLSVVDANSIITNCTSISGASISVGKVGGHEGATLKSCPSIKNSTLTIEGVNSFVDSCGGSENSFTLYESGSLKNSSFDKSINIAMYVGAAIYNTTFTNSGGGISAESSKITLDKVNFYGGGTQFVSFNSSGSKTIKESRFENIGRVELDNTNVTNTIFKDLKYVSGASLIRNSTRKDTRNSSSIKNFENIASNIYVYNSSSSNIIFHNVNGGIDASDFSFENCTFTMDSDKAVDGPYLRCSDDNYGNPVISKITNCTFQDIINSSNCFIGEEGNKIYRNNLKMGSAIRAINVDIKDSTFIRCNSPNDFWPGNSTIHVLSSDIFYNNTNNTNITNCTFVDCDLKPGLMTGTVISANPYNINVEDRYTGNLNIKNCNVVAGGSYNIFPFAKNYGYPINVNIDNNCRINGFMPWP